MLLSLCSDFHAGSFLELYHCPGYLYSIYVLVENRSGRKVLRVDSARARTIQSVEG